jgi:hypothetical protein
LKFDVIAEIRNIETIATGRGVRIYGRLVRQFGAGNWRKVKGLAFVRLETGEVVEAELHWYEAHGIGKRKMKVKRFLS